MRKYLIALGTAIAALGLVAQVSTADAHLLGRRSPGVTASQLIVGGAMTGTFIAKTYRHGRFAKVGSPRFWKWYGLTTVGCFALTPMMGAALVAHTEKRELKSSEVFIMLGDCVVPILGGLFWQAMFDANPHWDNGTGRPTR
jgi:hypothetical protein